MIFRIAKSKSWLYPFDSCRVRGYRVRYSGCAKRWHFGVYRVGPDNWRTICLEAGLSIGGTGPTAGDAASRGRDFLMHLGSRGLAAWVRENRLERPRQERHADAGLVTELRENLVGSGPTPVRDIWKGFGRKGSLIAFAHAFAEAFPKCPQVRVGGRRCRDLSRLFG